MKVPDPKHIITVALCALSSWAQAQEEQSAWGALLDSVTVRTFRYNSPIKVNAEGVTLWDMNRLELLPQVLGTADPVHYAQMLPGIQTNSEYRSGINIQGCDNQHNILSIGGTPLYNVNHLLGIFSTFNAPHFESMAIAKGATSSASHNRLGGQLDVSPSLVVQDTVSGTFSLGLIASQGTLHLPLSTRTTLSVSLRSSYLNWLYSDWLKSDEQQIEYSFYDANATLLHRQDEHNLFMLDYYSGKDHGAIAGGGYSVGLDARWGNYLGNLHWWYDRGELTSHTVAYITSYSNKTQLQLQGVELPLNSGISDIGLRNSTHWRHWSVGAEGIVHLISPQNQADKRAVEVSAWTHREYILTDHWFLTGGLRLSGLVAEGRTYRAIDPSLRLQYNDGMWQGGVSCAQRHQYLFQTGVSDAGLPIEYWISAHKGLRPQRAQEFILDGSVYLWERRYRISADVFYRKLYNQLCYRGTVLEGLQTEMENSEVWMKNGKGENYGFSLMLNKCAGRLTGWLSYTYTHARRTFTSEGRSRSYPASHERPHEVNGVITWQLNSHWDLGGTMVYASGTPFTPARSIYLLDNNILLKYGPYNAARLSPYMRFDLSANYKWRDRWHHEQGVNFSVYNVASRRNELFYYLRVHDDGTFVYRPVSFVLKVLPSLSYIYRF